MPEKPYFTGILEKISTAVQLFLATIKVMLFWKDKFENGEIPPFPGQKFMD